MLVQSSTVRGVSPALMESLSILETASVPFVEVVEMFDYSELVMALYEADLSSINQDNVSSLEVKVLIYSSVQKLGLSEIRRRAMLSLEIDVDPMTGEEFFPDEDRHVRVQNTLEVTGMNFSRGWNEV